MDQLDCLDTGVIRNVGATNEAITATFAVVGGLAGRNEGLISRSYATVTISISGTGGSVLGGVAGFNAGTILQSYAAASITSQPCCSKSVAGTLAETILMAGRSYSRTAWVHSTSTASRQDW
jgi:The GLUG motif